MDTMKVIAVDFDGTIVENAYPEIGKPNYQLVNILIHLQKLGHTIILYTCRDGELLQDAVNTCRHLGLVPDYVNENAPALIEQYGADCRKISADIYIDDRHLGYNIDIVMLYLVRMALGNICKSHDD